ncbi:MAG: hypothetical protein AB1486_20350 [Planctomycetota bacterium]
MDTLYWIFIVLAFLVVTYVGVRGIVRKVRILRSLDDQQAGQRAPSDTILAGDEDSPDLWGDPRKYEALVTRLFDTTPPRRGAPGAVAQEDVPSDAALRRAAKKLRTAEAHRRRAYHELLSVPGDTAHDVEWAEEFVENLLTNIASHGRGIMMAYALIQGWRQLMFVSHFPDEHAAEWERAAPNKPYLAWTRMEDNLKSIVTPDHKLVELMRRDLDTARGLTGTIGATIRRSMPAGTSLARTLCLLAELENVEATLERTIERWKEAKDENS